MMEHNIDKFDFLIDKILNASSRDDIREVISTYFNAWAKTEYTKVIYNQTYTEIKSANEKLVTLQERKEVLLAHIKDLKNPSKQNGIIDRKMISALEDALKKNGLETYNAMRNLSELNFIQKRINFLIHHDSDRICFDLLKRMLLSFVEDNDIFSEILKETRDEVDAILESPEKYYQYWESKKITVPSKEFVFKDTSALIKDNETEENESLQAEKCKAKIAYKSLHAANIAVVRIYEKMNVIQYSYKCQVCEYYHLTSKKGSDAFDYIKMLAKNT